LAWRERALALERIGDHLVVAAGMAII